MASRPLTSRDLVGLPLPAAGRPDMRLVLAVAAGVQALLMLLAPQLLNDADSHWHLVIGRRILAERALPWADGYSFTMAGQFWIAKEWLSQVLMALAHDLAGWWGVVMLAALAAALAFAVLTHELLRRMGWRPALVLTGAGVVLAAPHMLARPHLIALPALMVWSAGLLRAAETGRPPSFRLLPVMTLWANLHGSFLFGLALAAPLALEALLRAPKELRAGLALRWALFGLAAAAAACLHPYGPEAILAGFRVVGLGEAQKIIIEWQAHDFSHASAFEAALLALVAAGLGLGVRMPLLRLALLLVLLHMALAHVRHQTLFAMVGALLAAPAVAARFGAAERAPAPAPLWPPALAALALALAASLGSGLLGLARPVEANMPRAALAAARAAGLDGRVLNAYGFGGYLIAEGVLTFIDGRTELYGGPFVAAHTRALDLTDPEGLLGLLERYRIGWTLLQPNMPAVALLDRLPGWRRVHADAIAVVHARR